MAAVLVSMESVNIIVLDSSLHADQAAFAKKLVPVAALEEADMTVSSMDSLVVLTASLQDVPVDKFVIMPIGVGVTPVSLHAIPERFYRGIWKLIE